MYTGLAGLLYLCLEPAQAGIGLGAQSGPCLGASCPSRYQPPSTCARLGAVGRDQAYAIVVGGSFLVQQGSEAEGRVHVGADLVLRTDAYYNIVQVGAGACVVPAAADAHGDPPHLVVGGQINPMDRNATVAVGQPNLRSSAVVGGAPAGAGTVVARAGVHYQASLPPAPVDFVALAKRSAYWAGLPNTGSVGSANPMVLTGDGQSMLQVFSLDADVPSRGLRLARIPAGATVLINHQGSGTVNLQFYDMSDADGHAGLQFSTELTRRMLWNFPRASLVRLGDWAQWQGSVLVAQGSLYNSLPGLNGRVLVAGDLTQDGAGSEFHNYDFQGNLPDPPPDAPLNPETPPEPAPAATLKIELSYDGDPSLVTQAPQLSVLAQCNRSGQRSVQFMPPAMAQIDGLQAQETCQLTAQLDSPAQLSRGWRLQTPAQGQWLGAGNPYILASGDNLAPLSLTIEPVLNARVGIRPYFLGHTSAIETPPLIEFRLGCSYSGEQWLRVQAPDLGQSDPLQDGETCQVLERRLSGAALRSGYALSLPSSGALSQGATLVAGDQSAPFALELNVISVALGTDPDPLPGIPLLSALGQLGLLGLLGGLAGWSLRARPGLNGNPGCAHPADPGSAPADHPG